MAVNLSVTISNHLMDEINDTLVAYEYTNKSELVGELIRLGLLQWKEIKSSVSSGTQKNQNV